MRPDPASDERLDQALVEAINEGDESAFAALYARHRDWVARLALRMTGSQDDAMDVLQESFAYFLRKFPGFELRCSLRTFFYPVVKHSSATLRRKARPTTSLDTHSDWIDPRTLAAASPERECLAIVLQSLPAAQRETLLMRYVDDLNLEEISLALDIPLGTVKSRLHHALKRLRQDERVRAYFQSDES